MFIVGAKDAKYNLGELIDLARAAPVTVAKLGLPVVVLLVVKEDRRLRGRAQDDVCVARGASHERGGDRG